MLILSVSDLNKPLTIITSDFHLANNKNLKFDVSIFAKLMTGYSNKKKYIVHTNVSNNKCLITQLYLLLM